MDGSDRSLWFKINEDKGGEVVYFKRRNGRLWKLGDGTYGIVYVVHSELRGNDFAVKLLYDNESTSFLDRCHECRRKPSSAITGRAVEEAGWPPDAAASFCELVLEQLSASGRSRARAGPGRAAWMGRVSGDHPKKGQFRRGRSLQPRVDGVSGSCVPIN